MFLWRSVMLSIFSYDYCLSACPLWKSVYSVPLTIVIDIVPLILFLTHLLFNNMLFSFQVFVCFSVFLWLISSFIGLWSKKMLGMISVFLNSLRLVFCPSMWPILENIPCALEKYVHYAALGWNALKISIKSIWSSVSFKSSVSLLIFYLEDLFIKVSGGY